MDAVLADNAPMVMRNRIDKMNPRRGAYVVENKV